jgi:hypothetical protein
MDTSFRGRAAVSFENDALCVTVLREGGHVAEIRDKTTGVSPLWLPPWPSIEPTAWNSEMDEYGNDAESQVLSGLMGHNVCVDLFGSPSAAEVRAGVRVHGEAGIRRWNLQEVEGGVEANCALPQSQLQFSRTLRLDGRRVSFRDRVTNNGPHDRPIAWTEHVTLGPPFLERGRTEFRLPANHSRNIEESIDFLWPLYPLADGSVRNLQMTTHAERSACYTTHLLDPVDDGWFIAWSPTARLALAYVWRRADFPWAGIWEENHDRQQPPWNGRTETRAIEFGVSPFPESRRKMIERGSMFGEPAYRWIGAGETLQAEFYAELKPAALMPEDLNAFANLPA